MDTQDIINLLNTQHSAIEKRLTADAKAAADAVAGLQGRMVGVEQAIGGLRAGGGGLPVRPKTWGNQVCESERFRAFMEGGKTGKARIEIRAEITVPSGTSQADLVQPQRDGIAPLPGQALNVRGLLTAVPTTSNRIEFLRQTSRTVAARGVADGEMKPESAIGMELASADVITIAHWIDCPRNTLDDVGELGALIDIDLRYGLGLVEEGEVLLGDGTPQHLLGLVGQAAPLNPLFTVEAETGLDRLLLAIAQSQVAGRLPVDGVVVHPITLAQLLSTKDGEERYLGPGPFGSIPGLIWQIPVVPSESIDRGEALVGSFKMGARLHDRLLPEVLLSSESGDNFKTNMVTIRAEERLALSCRRADAFVFVDELGPGLTG